MAAAAQLLAGLNDCGSVTLIVYLGSVDGQVLLGVGHLG